MRARAIMARENTCRRRRKEAMVSPHYNTTRKLCADIFQLPPPPPFVSVNPLCISTPTFAHPFRARYSAQSKSSVAARQEGGILASCATSNACASPQPRAECAAANASGSILTWHCSSAFNTACIVFIFFLFGCGCSTSLPLIMHTACDRSHVRSRRQELKTQKD